MKLSAISYLLHIILQTYGYVDIDEYRVIYDGGETLYQAMEKALEILEKYRLIGKTVVYFSPVFGRIQPVEIVDFLMEKKLNDVKLQIQLHKVIWDPQKRGV